MTSRLILVLLAIGGLAGGGAQVRAQDLPTAIPESVGLSSERLHEVTRRLQSHVDARDIAGVVAAVVRHGRLVYLEALGELDRERGMAMRDDALFRLYSMTRPITSLATMILWEEDRFELDDPVSMYLPEFADQRVFVDASNPDMTATRPRRTEMTVEHLLLHTSGLGSRSSTIYRAEQVRLRSITLSQIVSNAARVPLFEDPGTRWRYGISTTILGRLVEIWSGMPFNEFLQERVFEPLGMTDTVFRVDSSRTDRFGLVYRPGPDGELRPHAMEVVPFTEQPALMEGGVGLVSTVRDYLRFAQMFLNAGELDGCACPSARYRRSDDHQPCPRRPPADRLRHSTARPRMDPRVLRRDGRRHVPSPGPRRHLLVGWLLWHPFLHRPGGGHGDRRHGRCVAGIRERFPGDIHRGGVRRADRLT